MTDYDELNRRRLAARHNPPAAGSDEWYADRNPQVYANLDELERLAAEFHRVWESKGFPGETWLQVEGTEKLAKCIGSYYNDPEDYRSSNLYVMIDGRLVWYLKIHHGSRFEGHHPGPDEITFMTYRQRVDEQARTLYGIDMEVEDSLRYMREDLGKLRRS
jgi:hypothetical protein